MAVVKHFYYYYCYYYYIWCQEPVKIQYTIPLYLPHKRTVV